MINLKVPEGTKDWAGTDIIIRDKIFSTATEIFKRHGGVTIDTPVFELREVLAGRIGIDLEQMFHLADQGGEICSLRYDLADSFTRWLAMNPPVQSIKCYRIAKVYRNDAAALNMGCMKEFYKCDFDIAGVYDPMLPDAEVLRIATEVLQGLSIEGYIIRVNHRKIIDGIFESCGVPRDKFNSVSSAIDKLDQLPWDDVQKEITQHIGLDLAIAEKIRRCVTRKGGRHLQYDLLLEEDLIVDESFSSGLRDMGLFFDYLEVFGVMPKVQFDLSFTRGYELNYTGAIFEIVTQNPISEPSEPEITNDSAGTVPLAAGGRQDDLVGMFSKSSLPCVGISFDVDEIFNITKARLSKEQIRASEVDVYVMAHGEGLLKERIQVCRELWDAGIKAEFSYKVEPELVSQLSSAKKNGIPFAIILSRDELEREKAKIVEMGLRDDHLEKTGVDVGLPDLVMEMKKRIGKKRAREGDEDERVEDNGFKEHMERVRVEGGTIEMEGIEIELDFAKIKSKGTEIEMEGAKIKLKKAKIELRGRRE